MMASTSSGRPIKCKALFFEDKLKIISEIEANPKVSRVAMAKKLGIPSSTLNGIVANQGKPLASSGNISSKCKRIKIGLYDEIENVLLKWFKEQRALEIPTDGPILNEKVSQIAHNLGIKFSPSNGWLNRFKNQVGIVYRTVSGESESVYDKCVENWKKNMVARNDEKP
ncbi:hypothetical protein PR048_002501 [Dryococelus australis]|uniref:HTH CENPB-type domain-containing protein n=1 Tax=Dryococelus australis TaxID=614101 RepID=A0ABQ9IKB9_9NEOP|nr:hypothetical protein PR048_002501 [Dryococelus australis]